MDQKNVKIFITMHKPFSVYKSNIFTPIQVGKRFTNIDLGILSDDTGDNIADKNQNYCELTAAYWVWKNYPELDYVGFYHYRRYLYLQDSVPNNGDNILNFICDDSKVIENINKYDILLPPKIAFKQFNVANQYIFCHLKEDWKILMNVLIEKYPDYKDDVIQVFYNNNSTYMYNMYIMRYTLFFKEYIEWLFDILFEVEKRIKINPYPYQARVFGFMSERLITLFVHRKIRDHNRIREFKTANFYGDTNFEKVQIGNSGAFF